MRPSPSPRTRPSAEAKITLPIEIRNEIARLEISRANTAGAVQLLDDRFRRRRVGLLSGTSVEAAQPLLSPLYYISRAVQPFADVREPRNANAAVAVPELIDANCSVIAMADIGNLTSGVEEEVSKWVQNGGVLVRFAGPRLAAATDALIPVTLRHGDRTLGGSLTWQTPQPLASFSDKSPFAGLKVPDDVTVTRQVLAEPDGALADRTWAALADGTPLVTAAPLGKGWLILFHVTADTSWSNLPLSGTFVEMLKRIIAFSSGTGGGAKTADASQPVAPYRLLDGYGHFVAPGAEAQPLSGDIAAVDARHQASARPLRHRGGLPRPQPARRQGDASRPRPRQRERRQHAPLSDRQAHRPGALAARPRAPAAGARRACGAVAERRLPHAPARGDRRHADRRACRRRACLRAPRQRRCGQRRLRHGGGGQDPSRLCDHRRSAGRRGQQGGARRPVAGARPTARRWSRAIPWASTRNATSCPSSR